MAVKSLSPIFVFALLAFSSLFGVSAAFPRKSPDFATAPAPSPDSEIDVGGEGLGPIPADIGFTPLNPDDPKAKELANHAIDQYNKANNGKLVFSAVLEATSAAGGEGTNYGLVLLAADGKDLKTYMVNVSVVGDVEKIISFTEGH